MTVPKVFIDGEAGTTGLQIYQRLADREDLEVISIDPDKRKVASERAKMINAADVAILCLPDDAAREAVSWVTNPQTKILDASTAHRTADEWVYGFPEMSADQRSHIATANRVSNPGCYPTGFLALMSPLVRGGLLPATFPATVNAISGYSGGGKKLIAQYEGFRAEAPAEESRSPYSPYGLGFRHKHVKEMQKYARLHHVPLFVPAVGDFAQGMVVQIPLPLWSLEDAPTGKQLHEKLSSHYANEPFVPVAPLNDQGQLRDGSFFETKSANQTNEVQLFVFANDETKEALLIARLDNLGKGASGAAVQNLNIMLGLSEKSGLSS
ncbi:N-acetyl-gamma-glutamyl-phosphate reductase [Synechococcus sp. PCC 7335]|uniref:N-acetyl-gamma-glutamyl-phosphate reductase n=1 Tax=Synechococcus sp. (strain ATCC 29403 / PCC 7335) TaxID=91464 RepID=UPI00017ECEEC|nr:N-acetyl-gamma-glutamyl-phosphate reductase [Synechococcus sp. PCC 7335]EDX84896.1 N-acetyl-gamma-glutamyl-phosphate reductase [Synechococcus sp. PCC 7335]